MSYDGGRLTPIQLFFLTAGFLFGTTTILTRVGPVQQDAWLTELAGGGLGILYTLMYLGILERFPGKTLIETAQTALGKVGGGLLGLLFFWYSLHLSALVARTSAELLTNAFTSETPLNVFIAAMLILSSLAARSGIETIARTTELTFLAGTILVPFATLILAIIDGLFDHSRLLPIMDHDLRTLFHTTLSQAAFPFGEMVILTMVLGLANDFPRGKRAVLWGVFYGITITMISIVRELAVLGTEDASHLVFPALVVVKLLHIGEFFNRFESLFMIYWIITAFIKLALCHYAAAVSLGQVLGFRDFRPLTIPVAGLVGGLSVLLVENILELTEFVNYYALYTLPIQVLFPLLLLFVVRKKAGAHHRKPTPAEGR